MEEIHFHQQIKKKTTNFSSNIKYWDRMKFNVFSQLAIYK